MSPLKTCIALTGFLINVALASPTSPPSNAGLESPETLLVNAATPVLKITNGFDGRNDQCGESTFQDKTDTRTSPLISDCLVINKNIAEGGRWAVEAVTGSMHQLVQFGTCALGAKTVPPYGDAFFYIGNADIIDVINVSIARFRRDGVVAANGTMHCKAAAVGTSVGWEIYFNRG